MLDALSPYIAFELSQWEVYGLFFLLGSFAVATLSDVKHMSAQREFMDVWFAFAVVLLGVELWLLRFEPDGPHIAKWVLIVGFGIVSKVGPWLRLAIADVAACVAAAMLLSPALVVVFFVLLKVLSWPAGKLLARGKPAYPFMPVVTAATVLLLAGAFSLGLATA